MKKINKTIAILSLGLFTTGFCGCNDELATEDAQKVSSETVLSSTTGLTWCSTPLTSACCWAITVPVAKMMLVMQDWPDCRCTTIWEEQTS